jgi:FlgD Ig-like domain
MKASIVTSLILITFTALVMAQTPLADWNVGIGTVDAETAAAVAVDDQGNTIVVGTFNNEIVMGGPSVPTMGFDDIYIFKFDPDGNEIWGNTFGGTGVDAPYDVAILQDNSIIIVGDFTNSLLFGESTIPSQGGKDVFIVNFDKDGVPLWVRTFGDSGSTQTARAVASDSFDNIVVTGDFNGSLDFGAGPMTSNGSQDVFVAKFNPSGLHMFSNSFGGSYNEYGTGVAIGSMNRIVITGYCVDDLNFGGGTLINAGSTDIFLAVFQSDGVHYWSSLYGDGSAQYGGDVVCDSQGDIIISGRYFSTIDFGGGPLTSVNVFDVCLAKLTGAGTHVWSKSFGSDSSEGTSGLAVTSEDKVCWVGYAGGVLDLGGGPMGTDGSIESCVALYEPDGTYLWGAAYENGTSDVFSDVYGLGSDVVLCGSFTGSIDFGLGDLVSVGGDDGFVLRLGDPATPTLMSITDVGFDQGRHVRIDFAGSRRDVLGSPAPVVQYEAYRRIDALPGAKLAGWEFVASVPAHGEDSYSMIAPTLADSTVTYGDHWSVFMLRAVTADPYVFWDTAPDSGYSLDNLAPAMPLGLKMSGPTEMSWDETTATDFAYYCIYQDDDQFFTGPVLLAHSIEPMLDVSAATGYLAVSAVDHAGNESALSEILQLSSGIDDGSPIARTCLRGNAPNPFNPQTRITFDLARDSRVVIDVHDLGGRRVANLLTDVMGAGRHHVTWNGRGVQGEALASGTYICRMKADNYVSCVRMQLIR